MGQEITETRFSRADHERFHRHLLAETELLATWFRENGLAHGPPTAGLELEAWLVDRELAPAPINRAFIERLGDPLVSPELATFNVEFNLAPEPLRAHCLSRMDAALSRNWLRARRVADELDAELVMIGILPTVADTDLVPENLSDLNRYQALNAEVLRQRGDRPLELDIHGHEVLRVEHGDVMLESATTSFQIHLQVPPALAVAAYNASIMASGPLVAVSANSPYLFGRDLWAETRIPLFEQSVEIGGYDLDAHGPMRRVTFGSGYARDSLMECFTENLEHYPVLLATELHEPPERLPHLRLHNGTLWRWNRPLIGFDDGQAHLRIEQRVVPAGPTVADAMANAAFYYGLTRALCEPGRDELPFALARDNFYACAQHGLDARIVWSDGRRHQAQSLLLRVLLPMARQGLEALGVADEDVTLYLGIIEARVKNACNGAAWQRAFVARHGRDMRQLLQAYLLRQNTGVPVHEWDT